LQKSKTADLLKLGIATAIPQIWQTFLFSTASCILQCHS